MPNDAIKDMLRDASNESVQKIACMMAQSAASEYFSNATDIYMSVCLDRRKASGVDAEIGTVTFTLSFLFYITHLATAQAVATMAINQSEQFPDLKSFDTFLDAILRDLEGELRDAAKAGFACAEQSKTGRCDGTDHIGFSVRRYGPGGRK